MQQSPALTLPATHCFLDLHMATSRARGARDAGENDASATDLATDVEDAVCGRGLGTAALLTPAERAEEVLRRRVDVPGAKDLLT
eukprot:SAG11_NODE_141_length_14934_cov_4.821503_11_plen_85_part_00